MSTYLSTRREPQEHIMTRLYGSRVSVLCSPVQGCVSIDINGVHIGVVIQKNLRTNVGAETRNLTVRIHLHHVCVSGRRCHMQRSISVIVDLVDDCAIFQKNLKS